MTSADDCPGEILLDIFDRVVGWDPDTYRRLDPWEPSNCDAHGTRIDTILACTRVCKAWTPFAQLALYRDIHIVAFQVWFRDRYLAEKKAGMHLHRVLQESPLLATYVQTLQISIFWRDAILGLDIDVHEPTANFVALVAVLPNLAHVDLTLDARDYSRELKLFAEADIASLAQSSRVRHLAVHSPMEDVPIDIMHQLLRAFPTIETLALPTNFICKDDPELGDPAWPVGVLPNLRHLRCSERTPRDEAMIPLLRHAPHLRTLVWTEKVDGLEEVRNIPQGIEQLMLHDFCWKVDLSHLTSLKRLEIIGDTTADETILACLRTAPPTLEELGLSTADDLLPPDSELVKEIGNLVRERFPVFSRIYIEDYGLNSGVLGHEALAGIHVALKPASYFTQYKPPYGEMQRRR
ncbi:hypothetical protein EXIGLDRAFT_718224 [Exidia glandulosa HHB12029]|uniref:F-box domain-containing protein n=1 Tax=Exidia glandulosa HHB12029 TaxID=1314781 RepID=A0A165HWD7_EXIGL|nr:hypothetical protein EXIGLDRAFT_718224 [Exidia glandulosa HHB12029]